MELCQNLWQIAGSDRAISPVLLARARELRKQPTPIEEILWECLRDRRFLNTKFREHTSSSNANLLPPSPSGKRVGDEGGSTPSTSLA